MRQIEDNYTVYVDMEAKPIDQGQPSRLCFMCAMKAIANGRVVRQQYMNEGTFNICVYCNECDEELFVMDDVEET